MENFQHQLNTIRELRDLQQQQDETLYTTRLRLHRTTQQLQRARRQYTVTNHQRDEQIAEIRKQIAEHNAGLGHLRTAYEAETAWLSRYTEQQQLVDQLQQHVVAAENRAKQLETEIALLGNSQPPASELEIAALREALKSVQEALVSLEISFKKASGALHHLEESAGEHRSQRQAIQSEMEGLRKNLQTKQGELAELLQPDFINPERLEAVQIDLENQAKSQYAEYIAVNDRLHSAIAGIYQLDPHPRHALSQLDDRTPFLLLPLRLESIFVSATDARSNGPELWVRAYPDEIAIHSHEKTLTDREVLAGKLYWTELLVAEHLVQEKENRRRTAWRHLVELFGGQRAAWVATQTKPSDWATLSANAADLSLLELLQAANPAFFGELSALPLSEAVRNTLEQVLKDADSDAFYRLANTERWLDRVNAAVQSLLTGFPTFDLTKTDAWSRAPRTRVLPDRLVLLLFDQENDANPREITGNLIPDTLYVGPDPLDAASAFAEKNGALHFSGAYEWMSDFDQAVQQGMGFRVSLSPLEAAQGFAKMMVLGVMASTDAADSARMLEELIGNHQYSPKGFSIVAQGTPTNNTELDGTGFSDNDPFNDLAFFTESTPPGFDPASPDPKRSHTDARLLADAFGIEHAFLQTVLRADQTDILEAKAMNTALFPGTLGYWLNTWRAPALNAQTARQTRSFFTQYVSCRGPLPAIRVGNQHYGVLLTSDFSQWKYPQRSSENIDLFFLDSETPFLKGLYGVLNGLDAFWQQLAADQLGFVGKPGTTSAQILMNILGLHPTSMAFALRNAFSEEYVRNMDSFKDGGRYFQEMQTLHDAGGMVRSFLQSLGYSGDPEAVTTLRALRVLWQHYSTPSGALNLVDFKPPSEANGLTFNYINWLIQADSTQKIIAEDFSFMSSDTLRPTTLLYLMLRNAVLLQLHRGTYDWLKERTIFQPDLMATELYTTLPGVRENSPSVSKYEFMQTSVSVAEPQNTAAHLSVADLIWLGPTPAEVEAAFLRQQKEALPILATLPTARLDRCFVEHLDCCTYRLDAWQTGLFAQRLEKQRSGGAKGIYLGAFGWVEEVRPAVKRPLQPEQLPPSLRPQDAAPILEEDDMLPPGASRRGNSRQGGFVHAPSLNHAAAAALLRNAYLSHADPEQAETFSVNLSSERVRRAQFMLEGLRNGQPVEALLGYQFERGLHDRSSESAARNDIPVLNLNQFILNYREAFPYESQEIAQNGGTATETVPAYSVVNGLKLIEATLNAANNYGISGSVTPTAAEGAIVVAEQDRVRDTLDAVKDLMMAENAYQLVQGNFDRVSAVNLAQKDAHIPPEMEVVKTPRGVDFSFSNRVTLHFDDLDPASGSSNPWPASAMTPRARAEAGMNHWLGKVLGAEPAQVFCEVYWIQKQDDGTIQENDRHAVSLAALHIQAVDFVWLASKSGSNTGGATELETRLVTAYCAAHAITPDKTFRIEFNPVLAGSGFTFAQIFPIAQQLRSLIGGSRALHAQDFMPAPGGNTTTSSAVASNPKGYDVAELATRVTNIVTELTSLANTLDGAGAPTVTLTQVNDPEVPGDDVVLTLALGAAFTQLETWKLSFTDTERLLLQFDTGDAIQLKNNLVSLADFGISDAYPGMADPATNAGKTELLARAHRLARKLRHPEKQDGLLDKVQAVLAKIGAAATVEAQARLLLEAAAACFENAFDCLPKFNYHNEIDLAASDADRAQLLSHALSVSGAADLSEIVEEWQIGAARVRPKLHRWEVIRTLTEALHDTVLDLNPVQAPYRSKDSWLAVEFPATDPGDPDQPFRIIRDTLSIIAHGASAFQAGNRQCGLLLDDWTEEIPTDEEITGISFRYNQPNAAPPQTLLLALTPEETGSWNWDHLVGILEDTLRRAKKRAVEPAQLEQNGNFSTFWNSLAPALVSEYSTEQEADVSLDLLLMLNMSALAQFYTINLQTN